MYLSGKAPAHIVYHLVFNRHAAQNTSRLGVVMKGEIRDIAQTIFLSQALNLGIFIWKFMTIDQAPSVQNG